MSVPPELLERLTRVETVQSGQSELLEKMDKKLDKIDDRLRATETRAASFGSLAGGITSVAIALISSKLTGKA